MLPGHLRVHRSPRTRRIFRTNGRIDGMIDVFIGDVLSGLILNTVGNVHTWMIETMFATMEGQPIPLQRLRWTMENNHACLSLDQYICKNGSTMMQQSEQNSISFSPFRYWNQSKTTQQSRILFRAIVDSKEREQTVEQHFSGHALPHFSNRSFLVSLHLCFRRPKREQRCEALASERRSSYFARIRVSMIFRRWKDLNRSWRIFPSV